jgi:regulator of sigma E protease
VDILSHLGGVLNFLVIVPILGVLMIAHEFGHFIVAKRSGITVEEFAIGFPPRLLSFTRGGVQYALNLIPLGAYVKMLGEEDPTAPGSFASQPKRIRAVVLAAGSGMNFLVAILVFALAYGLGAPDASRLAVMEVVPGTPGEASGFQKGDVILQVNGEPIQSMEQFQGLIAKAQGQATDVRVERDGQIVTLTTSPRVNPPQGQGAVGIKIGADRGGPPVRHGPIDSIVFGVRQTLALVLSTLSLPVLLLQGLVSPEAARPIGLPGMAQYAAGAAEATVKSGGWLYPLLSITGVFSAGLSVANMLPLPALDGGRLAFVVVEAIRGRRVSPEREGLIHVVGMAVLISLMIFISIHDLVTPLTPIDWGVR